MTTETPLRKLLLSDVELADRAEWRDVSDVDDDKKVTYKQYFEIDYYD